MTFKGVQAQHVMQSGQTLGDLGLRCWHGHTHHACIPSPRQILPSCHHAYQMYVVAHAMHHDFWNPGTGGRHAPQDASAGHRYCAQSGASKPPVILGLQSSIQARSLLLARLGVKGQAGPEVAQQLIAGQSHPAALLLQGLCQVPFRGNAHQTALLIQGHSCVLRVQVL